MNTEISADIPRLYALIAEVLSCLIYIYPLKKRFLNLNFTAVFLSGVIIGAAHFTAEQLPVIFWIPGMFTVIVAMYCCIYFYCDISWLDAGYCTARAFILAEFSASIMWQIYAFSSERIFGDSTALRVITTIVVYLIVYLIMYVLESKRMPKNEKLGVTERELGSAILVAIAAFLISNISFAFGDTFLGSNLNFSMMYLRTLVDFSGVVMLYAQHEQRQEMRLKHELDAINNVLNRQFEQYQLTKESIEVINLKYHDLRHQIAIIRSESDPEKQESYLAEMEHTLKMHEIQNKTGHNVVDIILSSKYIICFEKKITLTCVVDGKLLDFMDVMDICTIIGNALDNAIESVEKLSDPEKRLIKIAVYSQKNFIMLRFENYLEETIQLSDEILMTTKNDKTIHGYGIKSMKKTAEKYGGNLLISIEDGWFLLRILIPRQM